MSKKAWVLNETVIRDVCQGGDPFEHYHPEIAALYTVDVPDDAEHGWELQLDGSWAAPPPPPVTPDKVDYEAEMAKRIASQAE